MSEDRSGRRSRPWRNALRGEHRERVRRAVPIALLLGALVAAGVAAAHATRAQVGHRAAAEAALRDYGVFTAWSYQRAAGDLVESALHAALYPPRATLLTARRPEECLKEILAAARQESECGCSGPIAGRFAFMIRLSGDGPDTRFVGRPPEPASRAEIAAVVRSAARDDARDHGLLEIPDGDGPGRLVGYVRVGQGPDTITYGMEVDPARLAGTLAAGFESESLLPASLTRGRPNDELVSVRLTMPSGRTLYESRPGASYALGGEMSLRRPLEGAIVRAAVLPEVADQLVIGGLPRSQVPWMLVLFGLSGALALVAVSYLRRENRLARERTDFVASVSHELRTPLAQIRLFVETLRLGRTTSEEQREWALATVDRETLRLTRLVENVLHFSRAARGLEPSPEPLSLANEARAVVTDFLPLLRAGQAELDVDVPTGLQAEADPDAVRQVLLNLLDNAVKYGPAGQRIRIAGGTDGEWAWLAVEDQGPGVPAAERAGIWRSFRRGSGAMGSVATGSGIGLAVVRTLVESQGGRCRVDDAPGGGARFVVELPALVTPSAARVADPSSSPDRAEGAAAGGREAMGAA